MLALKVMNVNSNSTEFEQAELLALADPPQVANAAKLLESALDKGDVRAAHALATWYLNGFHFSKSARKAVKLLRIGAAADDPKALYDLAVCYETGNGVKLNERTAFEHYVRAALLGDKQSLFEIGRCYFYGIGCQKDIRLGRILKTRAESLGVD